jgi:hypothetical protein
MTATQKTIRTWFLAGIGKGATHMMVVYDTWDDYPVYVLPGQDVRKMEENYDGGTKSQRVMEVYNLSLPMEPQLIPGTRVFNY